MPHIAYIYKHRSLRHCSNGGISATCDYVTVYGPTEAWQPAPYHMLGQPAPPVRMVPSALNGAPPVLKPISLHTGQPLAGWFMYGGSMVDVDSFLAAHIKEIAPQYEMVRALALHDRRE